jgi:type IV secretion system protein VirD4
MDSTELGGFELFVVVAAAAGAILVATVWAGAEAALLVAGHPGLLDVSAAVDALGRLMARPREPALAWPAPWADRLPGPILYWTATSIVAGGTCLLVALAARRWRGSRVGTSKRRPLGVDARPTFAARRDLAPLLIRTAQPGRFVVGRYGRWLVATEDASAPTPRRTTGRRGDRGAVALVGPSRSGKTTAAISGILEWDGPAVLASVKADLLDATRAWRSHLGHVRVYDPTASARFAGPATGRWSPLNQADTILGAQRAARSLCDAAPRGGVDGGLDFWLAQAEILLSSLLFVARQTRRDMGAVCDWVLSQDRPGELGPGEVRVALDTLLGSEDPDVAAGAIDATQGLVAVWEMEERTRSSIYATAQTVVWPWSDPGVAASSRGTSINLAWLLSGANTVYLCAPIEDQKRLAPAFGGLLNDLITQTYRHVAATGRPLDPPLLIVIDEAGNTPLRALPEYASTLAGLGVLLVTIWQSLAQIEAAYGRQADTILTNHLTKVFYAGLSDPASIRYIGTVLGDAEVETRSRSTTQRPAGGSSQYATTRVALAPAHVVRQMRPGDALLLHGTLPPAHIRTRPFYRDPQLAARATQPTPDPDPSRAVSR